jgi:hypothetical protein
MTAFTRTKKAPLCIRRVMEWKKRVPGSSASRSAARFGGYRSACSNRRHAFRMPLSRRITTAYITPAAQSIAIHVMARRTHAAPRARLWALASLLTTALALRFVPHRAAPGLVSIARAGGEAEASAGFARDLAAVQCGQVIADRATGAWPSGYPSSRSNERRRALRWTFLLVTAATCIL